MESVHATCGCGTAGATLSAMPSARFRCHCTICQSIYAAAYSDVLVFRRGQVRPVHPGSIEWRRTKRVTPLVRGLCANCQEPVLAHLYGILTFVPARALPQLNLPEISHDIYYDTRREDMQDNLPKSAGLIGAYAGLSVPFLKVLVTPGRAMS